MAENDDLIESLMAGRGVMISMPPGQQRRVKREIRIRRAVEAAEDRAEIARRLKEKKIYPVVE